MPYHFSGLTDDPLAYERIESFGGGMDGFTRSTLLPPDVSQLLQNMVVLDNLEVRTRPGADNLGAAVVAGAAIQALGYFDSPTVEGVFAIINKRVWRWNGTTWAEIDASVDLSDAGAMLDMAQGVEKMLMTNVNGEMYVYDGSTFTLTGQGTTATDPPTGATILCWHAGRMLASGFPGGTAGKENDAIWVSKLLEFETGDWDGATRQFRIGNGDGDPIKALASLQDFTLAVLKENSVWLCSMDPTNIPANYSATQAVESLGFGVGCVGKKAWAVYGNDLLFMARDGVYSLRRMQAAAGQFELSAPLSQPIQNYIDRINWTYASGITAIRYKQYVLFSVPLDSSATNNAVLAFNGRLGRWVGAWTGWAPSHWTVSRFAGAHRLVFGTPTGFVRQWKDNNSASDNDTYLDDGVIIESAVWAKAFLFGEPVNDKDAYHVEMRFSSGSANINVTLMADNTESKDFTVEAQQVSQTLPIQLPFKLVSPGNITVRKGLRGLPPFNECFLKVESSGGWWSLRNITMSAFLNMLQNE